MSEVVGVTVLVDIKVVALTLSKDSSYRKPDDDERERGREEWEREREREGR